MLLFPWRRLCREKPTLEEKLADLLGSISQGAKVPLFGCVGGWRGCGASGGIDGGLLRLCWARVRGARRCLAEQNNTHTHTHIIIVGVGREIRRTWAGVPHVTKGPGADDICPGCCILCLCKSCYIVLMPNKGSNVTNWASVANFKNVRRDHVC